jgi:hypothetical protein
MSVRTLSIAALALSALFSSASAFSAVSPGYSAHGTPLPVTALESIASSPGEAKPAFLVRVADAMSKATAASGHEVCAVLGATPAGAYAVTLHTGGSQIGCYAPAVFPAGYSSTGETIASHVDKRHFHLVRADLPFVTREPGSTASLISSAASRVVRRDPAKFDRADVASGLDYLVAGGALIGTEGDGSEVVLAELAKG